MSREVIAIDTEFIRLDALLKLAGAVPTGGQAKVIIQSGRVQVNGEPACCGGKDAAGRRGGPARDGQEIEVSA